MTTIATVTLKCTDVHEQPGPNPEFTEKVEAAMFEGLDEADARTKVASEGVAPEVPVTTVTLGQDQINFLVEGQGVCKVDDILTLTISTASQAAVKRLAKAQKP